MTVTIWTQIVFKNTSVLKIGNLEKQAKPKLPGKCFSSQYQGYLVFLKCFFKNKNYKYKSRSYEIQKKSGFEISKIRKNKIKKLKLEIVFNVFCFLVGCLHKKPVSKYALRLVPLYTEWYGRIMKERNPLMSIITRLTGKTPSVWTICNTFRSIPFTKKTEETLLPCKLFDMKSIIKINSISLGIPLSLRAK